MNAQLLQRSQEICEKFWQWRLLNFPEYATSVGEHQYDDKLTDTSLDGFDRRLKESKEMLHEVENLLATLKENSLPSTNVEVLASELDTYISGFVHQPYLYAISICEGPHYSLPRLIRQMPQSVVSDYTNILARMKLIPTINDNVIGLMKEGINRRKCMHKCSVGTVSAQLKIIVNSPLEKSPFFESFLSRPPRIALDKWNDIVREASDIIEKLINPSFQKIISFLDNNYLHHLREKISVESLPGGKSYYNACLKYHTSTDLTPAEIHAIGIKEVKRIQNRINILLNEIAFEGSYIELIDVIEQNNMAASSDDDIITGYSILYNNILKELPKLFNCLPKRTCEIKTTNSPNMPSGHYVQGDDKQPGVFWINTEKVKNITFKSLALALHEMLPGHHLQNDILLEKRNVAKFRRFKESGNYCMIPARFPLYTAYMEGWALYAESLGEQMGVYKNPYQLLGRLYSEICRAARLVVDTGIHAFDWSKEQAINYMIDVVGMDTSFATSEVYRYITWPGQACSYKIGELKIIEHYEMLRNELGSQFDIKEFHDILLHSGEVPFEFIERNIRSYADSKIYGYVFDASSLS